LIETTLWEEEVGALLELLPDNLKAALASDRESKFQVD